MPRTTSATQHASTRRIYQAAVERKLIPAESQLTGLAKALDMSTQLVKNWDSRGPSEKGLNQVQERLGINSTWVRTGQGARFVNDPVSPPPDADGADGSGKPPGRHQASSVIRLTPRSLSLAQRLDALSEERRKLASLLIDQTLIAMEAEDSSAKTKARSRKA